MIISSSLKSSTYFNLDAKSNRNISAAFKSNSDYNLNTLNEIIIISANTKYISSATLNAGSKKPISASLTFNSSNSLNAAKKIPLSAISTFNALNNLNAVVAVPISSSLTLNSSKSLNLAAVYTILEQNLLASSTQNIDLKAIMNLSANKEINTYATTKILHHRILKAETKDSTSFDLDIKRIYTILASIKSVSRVNAFIIASRDMYLADESGIFPEQSFTQNSLDYLPSWMEARRKKSANLQKFLNHSYMKDISDSQKTLHQIMRNSFLNTTDKTIMDYSFKLSRLSLIDTVNDNILPIENISELTFTYRGKKMEATENEALFASYMETGKEYVYYYDIEDSFYFVQPYEYNEETNFKNNIYASYKGQEIYYRAQKDTSIHHIWNLFDEFGLLKDVSRLKRFEENNEEFLDRINDACINPPGPQELGLRNHITRSFNIKDEDVSINNLSNDEYRKSLLKDNLLPTHDMVFIMKQLEDPSFFWGKIFWDEDYWDTVNEESYEGLKYRVD